MKLIILVTSIALVLGDNHEDHHSRNLPYESDGSKQSIEYGLPFLRDVNLNRFTKDFKSEFNANKAVTVTSSSSHSHSFKNRTSVSTIHKNTRPSVPIFLNVPHKNIVSLMSQHSTLSQLNNRIRGGEIDNKVKTLVSGSQQGSTSDASHYDDGSYKAELHKTLEDRSMFDDASNYDDGSYKPELYKNLDNQLHDSYGHAAVFNDGAYNHEASHDHQIIKSNEHRDELSSRIDSNDASKYDDGAYKPELYETSEHTSHKSIAHSNTATDSFIDDSLNRNDFNSLAQNDKLNFEPLSEYGAPEGLRTDFRFKDSTKSYKQEASHTGQLIKSTQHIAQIGSISSKLHTTVDLMGHSSGAKVGLSTGSNEKLLNISKASGLDGSLIRDGSTSLLQNGELNLKLRTEFDLPEVHDIKGKDSLLFRTKEFKVGLETNKKSTQNRDELLTQDGSNDASKTSSDHISHNSFADQSSDATVLINDADGFRQELFGFNKETRLGDRQNDQLNFGRHTKYGVPELYTANFRVKHDAKSV